MSSSDYYFNENIKATEKNFEYAKLFGRSLGALNAIKTITKNKDIIDYIDRKVAELENDFNTISKK